MARVYSRGVDMAKQYYLVWTQPPEGVSDQEFNDWYEVHVSEVLALRGFVSAERFVLRMRRSTSESPAKYSFGIRYEIEGDFEEAWRRLRQVADSGGMFSTSWSEDILSIGWQATLIGPKVVAAHDETGR
jgi:hypothetical protein